MKFIDTNIFGVIEIVPNILSDDRGCFVKTFHAEQYRLNRVLDCEFKEEYFSVSRKGVLRGLHFQRPPHAHAKLVYCVSGEVRDVFMDLRKNSPTFGRSGTIKLSSDEVNILYLPEGIAHGFYTLSKEAIMVYKTTSVYHPDSDDGLHWRSCEASFSLGSNPPILSERDQTHLFFSEFNSPFDGEVKK